VQAVTAEDIQRVAQRYLVDDQLTVGRLIPRGQDQADNSGEEE